MDTLLLDTVQCDLLIDADGDIAVASDPYSQAQDAASEIKTFQGEVYYDTTKGNPYFSEVLGYAPPISLMKSIFQNAAKLVPGVVTAVCYIASFVGRKITGQVQITNGSGQTSVAGF